MQTRCRLQWWHERCILLDFWFAKCSLLALRLRPFAWLWSVFIQASSHNMTNNIPSLDVTRGNHEHNVQNCRLINRYQNLLSELVAYEVGVTAKAQMVSAEDFVWVPVLSQPAHSILVQAKIQAGISKLQDDVCGLCAMIAVHSHPPSTAQRASVDLQRITNVLVSVHADLKDKKKSCSVFRDHLDDAVEVFVDRLFADLGRLLHRYLVTHDKPEIARVEIHLAAITAAYVMWSTLLVRGVL
jgi:hypothetical protein